MGSGVAVSYPDHFGITPSGEPVERVSISGGGLCAAILTYGATVQDLRLDGIGHPLVLGSTVLSDYLGPLEYVGAMVGRYANRIGGGRITVEGKPYLLDRNDQGRNCLHGGRQGASHKNWRIITLTESSATLATNFKDGEMGFPGDMSASVTISLLDAGVFQIEIAAQCTKPSPCSFAHHGYFNLDGSEQVSGHWLKVPSRKFLPVDELGVPEGPPRSVDGSRYDFRLRRAVGPLPIDGTFCLSSQAKDLRPVAWLTGPASGLTMRVETTEPGLQIYNGAHFPDDGPIGISGNAIGPFAGLALECQNWPDAPNRPDFPDAILYPGQTYLSTTRYVFSHGAAKTTETNE